MSGDPAAPIDPLAPAPSSAALPRPPRPRVWTLAVACVALLVGVMFMVLMSWALVTMFPWILSKTPIDTAPTAALDHLLAYLQTLPGLVATATASAVVIGGVAIVASLFSPVPFLQRLRLGRPRLPWGGWVLAILGGLAVSEGSDALLQWSGIGRGETLDQMTALLAQARGTTLALAVLTIGLLAGTAEELFFRGYLQSRLVQRFGAFAGIAIASGLFALAHLDSRHSFFALVFGSFVGWIAWRTGSIWPGVAIHVVNNAASTLMSAAGAGETPDSPATSAIAFFVSVAVLAASIAGLRRLLPPREARA